MKPYSCCSNSIPTFPRLSGMSLKPTNGSELDGSDMEPGPWSGEGFHSRSQHVQQGQDAEHQGNGNRRNMILATQTMLAKASTAQSRGRPMQNPAGQIPVSLCTCTTAWCSSICHAVPPLSHSTPPSPPAFLPVSLGTLRCTHSPTNTPWACQRLAILSAQTSHAARGASCITHGATAVALLPSLPCPSHSASRSSAQGGTCRREHRPLQSDPAALDGWEDQWETPHPARGLVGWA